jgi:hypothetical protein
MLRKPSPKTMNEKCSVCDKPAPWRILNEEETAYIYWCNRHHRELCPNDHSSSGTRTTGSPS